MLHKGLGKTGYSPMLTPPVLYLAYSLYIATLCLNQPPSCVDFVDVITGDIPVNNLAITRNLISLRSLVVM